MKLDQIKHATKLAQDLKEATEVESALSRQRHGENISVIQVDAPPAGYRDSRNQTFSMSVDGKTMAGFVKTQIIKIKAELMELGVEVDD